MNPADGSEDTALRPATEAAPRVVVNGYDVAHVLARGRRC